MNDNILKDAVQYCRHIVDELNTNSIAVVLRKQNEAFDKALGIVENLLPKAEMILDQDVPNLGMKAATMFLVGLWSRLRQGDQEIKLTRDDVKDLLGDAYEQVAGMDPGDYTRYVFDLYKRSIAFAIEPMRPNASPDVIRRLEEIVSLMDGYSEELESGTMPETKYIEENLWLSLEAVFLVLTDRMSHSYVPEERRELAEAVGALVFQKFRLDQYEKELAAIDACLEYQADLDKKLTEQVNAYIDALNDELDEFDALVEKAFDSSDYRTAFRGSAALAKSLGAEDILRSKQDVDDYFKS